MINKVFVILLTSALLAICEASPTYPVPESLNGTDIFADTRCAFRAITESIVAFENTEQRYESLLE